MGVKVFPAKLFCSVTTPQNWSDAMEATLKLKVPIFLTLALFES